jgi:Domain of unknown function (DUF4111)/Nucleotidyltransferase domain
MGKFNVKSKNQSSEREAIHSLIGKVQGIFGEDLVGFYLTGSLSYGDFNPKTSDIDFVVVTKSSLAESRLGQLETLHQNLNQEYPEWAGRMEGSYLTLNQIHRDSLPSRPYANHGAFWRSAPYGHEWLIQRDALNQCGLTLFGPKAQELFLPIEPQQVRSASKQIFEEEWLSKLDHPELLNTAELQVYGVLTLCKILYGLRHTTVVSKRMAAEWVSEMQGEPWASLIDRALAWEPGKAFSDSEKVLEFIRFICVGGLNGERYIKTNESK